ncbi:MAG: TolC family protein [Thiogranum sp.]|jgi:outer membrane protein TolC
MPDLKSTLQLLTAICTIPLTLAAGAATPSLPAAIQAGYEHYPQRPLSDAVRLQGEALGRQADSLVAGDPSFMLRHENDSYIDDNGFRQWEGGLAMPLWLPGQRASRRHVALATRDEADGLQRFQRWQVAGEIRELLWSLRIAETELALADAAVARARDIEIDVDKRYGAGELARTDLILAQKETLARRTERVAAAAQQARLLQQYRAWTGLTDPPADIDEQLSSDDAIGEGHPALEAARYATSLAQARRDQARRERRANPVLTLGGKSERAESGLSYDTAMTFEITLPLGTSAQAGVITAQAERDLAQANAELAGRQRELETELIRTRAEHREAVGGLELAQQQYQLAEEGLRLTRRAFELGESDLFTLLQAHTQALAAEQNLSLRRLELGRAIARYNQALGVIPE